MYRKRVSTPRTPLELAALATAAVPGLSVAALREPQFSDEVVSMTGIVDDQGNRWTVVCPHEDVGGVDLRAQWAVLARLASAHDAGEVGFDVPRPAGIARTREGVSVMVHQDLAGRFMGDEDFDQSGILPASLARSIASLHNLPVSTYSDVNVPQYSASECRDRHRAVLQEVLAAVTVPANLVRRWRAALDDDALWRFRPCPVHGDLHVQSVKVADGIVLSISGFSSAHVGDPAIDVAWILSQASDGFLETFQSSYSMTRMATDLHLVTRAQLLSELAIVRWLSHGLHAEDKEIVRDASQMLTDVSLDVGDDLLTEHELAPEPKDENAPADEPEPAAEPVAPTWTASPENVTEPVSMDEVESVIDRHADGDPTRTPPQFS